MKDSLYDRILKEIGLTGGVAEELFIHRFISVGYLCRVTADARPDLLVKFIEHGYLRELNGDYFMTQSFKVLLSDRVSIMRPTGICVLGTYLVLTPDMKGTTDFYDKVFRLQRVDAELQAIHVSLPEYYRQSSEEIGIHTTMFAPRELHYATYEEIVAGHRIL